MAERRARDAKTCGGAHADEHGQLPADVQAEVIKAENESRSEFIDVTGDDSDEDDSAYASPDEHLKRKADTAPVVIKHDDSDSDEIEFLEPAIKKQRARDGQPMLTNDRPLEKNGKGRAAPLAPESMQSPMHPEGDTWACATCTYQNVSALSLCCEVCGAVRPPESVAALASGAAADHRRDRTSGTTTFELDEGWACPRCGVLNDHQFWSCALCLAVKTTSTKG